MCICGPCAGVKVDYVCTDCGRAGQQYYGGLCNRCSARRRAAELLSGPVGVAPELAPLVDILTIEERARSAIRWMSRPWPAALLRHLASLRRAPTHADLDQLPPSNSLHYLRHLMVYADMLPKRIEPLERIEPWLDSLLRRLPAHQARLIGPYAQWSVLRKARRRAVRRTYTPASAERDRSKITTAIGLLGWLDAEQLPLHQFTQPDLEAWLDGNDNRISAIAGFIAWLNNQHITDNLQAHQRRGPAPSKFPDPDGQIGAIQTLLSGSCDSSLEVRVAGLLVLLYGVNLTTICKLKTTDLKERNGKAFLTFARHPVLLPPTVAALIDQLATDSRRRTFRPYGQSYLFPSATRIGAPVSAQRLTKRLNDAGIHVRINRNGALLTLAQDLPAPVLAELLGLHINTAARWCQIAQRDWSYYLSARVQNQRSLAPS
jgi:hypothetical protein